jgi:hypothetical protein
MKRKDYYEQLHKKELKTFNVVLKKIVNGLMLITHCSFEKLSVGDGYRFIVYLRDAE